MALRGGRTQEAAGQPAHAGGEAAEVVQALEEAWPDHPEWVDMLTAILQDEPMSATYGWFRTAVAQTRFDWAVDPQALRP